MSARDDYPYLDRWVERGLDFPAGQQVKAALDEIDRLRENNTHQASILRDVLPIMHISPRGAMLKIDHTWMLVVPDTKEPT